VVLTAAFTCRAVLPGIAIPSSKHRPPARSGSQRFVGHDRRAAEQRQKLARGTNLPVGARPWYAEKKRRKPRRGGREGRGYSSRKMWICKNYKADPRSQRRPSRSVAPPGLLSCYACSRGLRPWLNYVAPAGAVLRSNP
jgi:hypothetical protein